MLHLLLLECFSISELTEQNIIYNPASRPSHQPQAEGEEGDAHHHVQEQSHNQADHCQGGSPKEEVQEVLVHGLPCLHPLVLGARPQLPAAVCVCLPVGGGGAWS